MMADASAAWQLGLDYCALHGTSPLATAAPTAASTASGTSSRSSAGDNVPAATAIKGTSPKLPALGSSSPKY